MLTLPKNLPKRLFITGTDTEIGKTVVTCLLIQHLNDMGLKTIALKPVASGCQITPEGLRNEDALKLQAAASIAVDYRQVNPWSYLRPVSPHIAAGPNDPPANTENINKHLDALPPHDILIIEGAGGWQSPISDAYTNQALCSAYQAHPILVVGLKLGCLNHALLSAQAMVDHPQKPLGWISNTLNPEMEALQENIDYLKANMPLNVLGHVPYQETLVEPTA